MRNVKIKNMWIIIIRNDRNAPLIETRDPGPVSEHRIPCGTTVQKWETSVIVVIIVRNRIGTSGVLPFLPTTTTATITVAVVILAAIVIAADVVAFIGDCSLGVCVPLCIIIVVRACVCDIWVLILSGGVIYRAVCAALGPWTLQIPDRLNDVSGYTWRGTLGGRFRVVSRGGGGCSRV